MLPDLQHAICAVSAAGGASLERSILTRRYIIVDGAVLTTPIIEDRQRVINQKLKTLESELRDLQIARVVLERLTPQGGQQHCVSVPHPEGD